MIKFTYEDILARMKSNLQTRLGNTGILFYSTNQKILEAIAEELSEEMRFDEYLTRESKWTLAQNITSIMNQTDFFNYEPHRQIGSLGNIKVASSETFSGSYSKNILIPKFTQFTSEDGITFSSSKTVNLLSSQDFTIIPVVQGVHKISTFDITAAYTESELELLNLLENNENIEDTLYEVRVNGILWEQVESLGISASSSAQYYTLKTNKDFSGIVLGFGDDIQSKKLEYGDTVVFHYLETLGSSGEVLQTNIVNKVIDNIYDVSESLVKLYCTNIEQIIGGDSIEDIETIRDKAPKALRLSSRVITSEDYVSYLLDQGLLDKLIVWGELEQNEDANRNVGTFIALSENAINISGLTYSESLIISKATESQKLAIRNSLVDVKGITDIVNFVDPKITFLKFNVLAYYDNSVYTSSLVKEAISSSLFNEFSIDNTTFKQNLFFSRYYELINSLVEVDHHETNLTLIQYNTNIVESSANLGSYFFDLETNYKDLVPGSVSIYVKNIDGTLAPDHPHADWFLVGTDNGNGIFTGSDVPESLRTVSETPEDYIILFESEVADLKYSYGKVCNEIGDTSRVHIDNGLIENSEDYQIKFEFKTISDSRVSVVPINRHQIFVVETVNISTDII